MIIVLASLCAGIFGLVNLVKPLGWLRITRRRYAAGVVAGSVFMFLVGGLIGAASQPGGLSAGAADPAANEKAAPGPARKAAPAGLTQAEFDGLWEQIKTAMAPCDAQVEAAGGALSRGDAYAAYPLVTRARETCMSASSAISNLPLPRSAKGDARKALNDGRDACGMAMFLKRQAMGAVAKVVDGDNRPSAVSAAQAEMESAGSQTMQCIIGMGRAAAASELVLPEFKEVMEEAAAEDATP